MASPGPGNSSYFPGMYDQPSAAPPGSPFAAMPPGRQEEHYMELDQEKSRRPGEDSGSLAREAQSLREQIRAEQERRQAKISEYTMQLEGLERDNKQLQMKLMKVQMQDSAKLTDVTTVKKEVVAKTMELEKMMREFQQSHQERLYARVWDVTSKMLAVAQKQPEDVSAQMQMQMPAVTSESLAVQAPIQANPQAAPFAVGAIVPANTVSAPSNMGVMAGEEAAPSSGTMLDLETQQLLKKRLQSLGDVVVHASDKFEACCASGRVIPPGSLRVRPRRCDHVFLVECLMPYWAEGLCPVCRCSFAYDRPQDAGYDESDRYSSVSTSISQAMPRHMQSSSNSDAGSLRGPRALLTIGEASKEQRGRSSSAARRRRGGPGTSTSQGRSSEVGIPASPDARGGGGEGSLLGEVARRGNGAASPSPVMPGSPSRSVVSVSRSSSVPRDRGGPLGQAMQQASRPL